jgi:hypothetical protein
MTMPPRRLEFFNRIKAFFDRDAIASMDMTWTITLISMVHHWLRTTEELDEDEFNLYLEIYEIQQKESAGSGEDLRRNTRTFLTFLRDCGVQTDW